MSRIPDLLSLPPTRRSTSLYHRILAIITAIFVVMAVVIAIGMQLFVKKNEELFWNERQTEAAENAASQIAGYIEKNESTLGWLDRFGFNEMKTKPELMRNFLDEHPDFLEVAFLDQSGRVLLSGAGQKPILANQFTIRQSQWFRTAQAGEKYYSRVQTSPQGESYLVFAMPSSNHGVLVAQIRMDGLWRKVASITFGESGTVYVANRDGRIIAHRNPQLVLANRSIDYRLQFQAILSAADNNYSGSGTDLLNTQVKVVSTKIAPTGWIVIAELPEKEAFAFSRSSFIAIPLGLILVISLSAIVVRHLLRREFLQPVELLRTGALQLSQGQLSFRHTIPARRDELCQVMEVFNSMADRLADRQAEQEDHAKAIATAYRQIELELEERAKVEKELKKLNDELEQRVDERTSSLRQANSALTHEMAERKQAEKTRQELESQLRQAQKMQAIGTLAGGIAHDFNNILGAIIGYAEMIREDCPADSGLAHDLDQILTAGNRAKELVKQILTFSRQSKANAILLQPGTMIKEVIKLLRSSIPTTIAIKQDIDPKAGVILADPTQFHQILLNLCTNAYHAMEQEGGTLTIKLKQVNYQSDEDDRPPEIPVGEYVELTVSDTGCGIAPEIIAKIFEPYFTTKEVGKGTGMGLAMVHGIVKSCGGFIDCTSRFGKGSVFRITLPALTEIAAVEDEANDSLPRGQERVLLVDDEEILLEMSTIMLERLGYTVSPHRRSSTALAEFIRQPEAIDLVITDQTMPNMTGSDMAGKMLQIRPDLPIILCTGYSSLITADGAKAAGIKGFAMKPMAKTTIATLIREVLGETKQPRIGGLEQGRDGGVDSRALRHDNGPTEDQHDPDDRRQPEIFANLHGAK